MCMSLRGATYYGASLHISVAILFLGGFFVDLVGIAEVWHNPYATYFSLILAFIYICLFLVFGLLIFRGVELESVKLLKGSVAGFLVLQISAFLVYVALLALTNSRKMAEKARKLEERLTFNVNEKRWKDNDNETTVSTVSTNEGIVDGNSTVDDLNVDVAIVTVLQIIMLVIGILITVGYVCVVVKYVRSLCPRPTR